jgi:hypothetical protein
MSSDQHAVDAARTIARRAVIDVARQTGAETVQRPAYRGASSTIPDLGPEDGLRAAREIELAARHAARGYVRDARAAGLGWREIGEALNLGPNAAERGLSAAEAAFDYAAPSADSHWSRTYGPSVIWRCGSCAELVTDHGPYAGLADAERGHADRCARREAEVTAWERQWEAE